MLTVTAHTTLGHRGPPARPSAVELVAAAITRGAVLSTATHFVGLSSQSRVEPWRWACVARRTGEAVRAYEASDSFDNELTTFFGQPWYEPAWRTDGTAAAAAGAFVRAVGPVVAVALVAIARAAALAAGGE